MDQYTVDFEETTIKDKVGQNKGALAMFGAVVVLTCVTFGCIPLVWDKYLLYPVQLVGFVALGLLHLHGIKKSSTQLSNREKWWFTLLIAATIMVLLSCVSFLGTPFRILLIFASACAFVLPFVMAELWRFHRQISYEGIKLWHPSTDMTLNPSTIFLNGTTIRFKIKLEQEKPITVNFRASDRMPLGEIFYDMLEKQRKSGFLSMTLTDSGQKPFEWIFFTSGILGWNRFLNPDASLSNNRIGKNAAIYAQRITEETLMLLDDIQELNVLK